MLIFSLILLILFSEQQSLEVEVFQIERPSHLELWAKNPHIFPVTVEFSADLTNLESTKELPFTFVIQPSTNIEILRLTPKDLRREWSYSSNYATYLGDIFAEHQDDFAYQLPYRIGSSHIVSQGYNGTFSHTGTIAYSIDFTMPSGTQIYAARGGTVIEVVNNFDEGGNDKRFVESANYITILHDDGTLADYSHLEYDGARVVVGQTVRMGQFIGYSGATGFVTGPHLHFGVKRVLKGGIYQTVPVKFASPNGPVTLEMGNSYTAY